MVPSCIRCALSLTVLSCLALAGCSSSSEVLVPLPTTTTQTPVVAEADSSAPGDVSGDLYAEVLNTPEQYSFTTGANYLLNGKYSYALADITGDGHLELVLRAGTSDHMDPIRIFTVTESQELLSPTDTLLAGSGGHDVDIFAAPEGDRIFQRQWHSLRPEMTVKAFALQGDRLLPTGEEFKDDTTAPSGRIIPLIFHDIDDRAALDSMEPTLAEVDAAPNPTPPPTATADYPNTFTGAVQVMTAPELARHQGFDQTPNGEDDTYRFALFLLDSPTMVTGRHSGNPGPPEPREATMIELGEISPYTSDTTGFDLDGRRLSITVDPEKCVFPSDASLPLGEPGCRDVTIH